MSQAAILSDLEMLERLVAEEEECIFVSPLVNPAVQIGPSSLDVHLGTEFSVGRVTRHTHIDLVESKAKAKHQVTEYGRTIRVPPGGEFVLHRGEFALGATLEFIGLPDDIAARLQGRSTFGRLGLQVHATAGFVDPGFSGTLTFELINAGKLPLKISPGLRLGQVSFFNVDSVQVPYGEKQVSKYFGALGVGASKIHEDPEVGLFRRE